MGEISLEAALAIDARNRTEDRADRQETRAFEMQKFRETMAEQEKAFWVGLAFNEAKETAERTIQHFIKFVDTIYKNDENKQAQQLNLEEPHVKASTDFEPFNQAETRRNERDEQTAEDIAHIFNGTVPSS